MSRWFAEVNHNPVMESFDQIREWFVSAPKHERDAMSATLRSMPYREFLKTYYWRSIRLVIFSKFGGACGCCQRKDGLLDVHHTTYEHHGREHENIYDLRLLCRDCHEEEHEWERAMDKILKEAAGER